MKDVVLVHGMWMTGSCWAAVVRDLERRGYRAFAPTLPYHAEGLEEAPDGLAGTGLDRYTDFLESFVRDLGLAVPPVLVGHSMGGLLAQKLAERLEFAALALVAPVPPRGAQPLDLRRLVITWKLLRRNGFRFQPHRPAHRDVLRWMAPEGDEPGIASMVGSLCPESGRVLFEMECWPLDWRGANRVRRDAIRCPVWIAGGGRDPLVGEFAVRDLARWYGVEPLIYPESGHLLIGEGMSATLVRDLCAWLEGLDGLDGRSP